MTKSSPQSVLFLTPDTLDTGLLRKQLPDFQVFSAQDMPTGRFILSKSPDIKVVVAHPAMNLDELVESDVDPLHRLRVIWLGAKEQVPQSSNCQATDTHHLPLGLEDIQLSDLIRSAGKGGGASNQKKQKIEANHCETKGKGLALDKDWLEITAHDIRLPLSIITSYAAHLESSEEDLNDSVRAVLSRIRLIGERLQMQLNNLLTISAMEDGKIQLQYKSTPLSFLLEEVQDDMMDFAEKTQVRLECGVKGEDNEVRVDIARVEQILQNLVSNAIKFSPSGGRVVISAETKGDTVLFSVSDEGTGIPAEETERIFEKFTRAVQSEKSPEGNGLGLAIARSLVAFHGGRIWVDSQPGKGSTFTFTVATQPKELQNQSAAT